MVRDHDIISIILPWPAHAYVRQRDNWTFDLQVPSYTGPMDIPHNVNVEDDGTDVEYERRHMSPIHDAPRPPTHTSPGYANPFAGTSSGFTYIEDMFRDQMAREEDHDGLFYTMYEQQHDIIEFMQESPRQTDRTLKPVTEA